MISLTFIPLQERHFPFLLKWLEMPHVKAWWDKDVKWNIDLIKKKYASYVHGYKMVDGQKKLIQAYIICVNDQEIGYIQQQKVLDLIVKAVHYYSQHSVFLIGLIKPLMQRIKHNFPSDGLHEKLCFIKTRTVKKIF